MRFKIVYLDSFNKPVLIDLVNFKELVKVIVSGFNIKVYVVVLIRLL